jgi:DNA-binding FrmR family transcriptional regulator
MASRKRSAGGATPTIPQPTRTDRDLADQAKARLRRIEGQVRGIQGMLDRLDEEQDALGARVRDLLATGKRQTEVARVLGLTRRRVADLAQGRCGPEGEPCDSLLTQVLAVHAAVEQVGLLIMELHLQRCVLEGVPIGEGRLQELRESLRLWSRLASG